MSKRILAILLSLTLVFTSLFSLTAFADEVEVGVGETEVIGETEGTEEAIDETEEPAEEAEVPAEEAEEPAEEAAPVIDLATQIENEKLAKSASIYNSMIEQIGLLKSLDIMSDAREDNMLEEVTREQFVRYMLQFMNVDASAAADGVSTYYNDVPTDYEYYEDITTATVMGIINGDPRGNFNPNNTITYQDALKIVVGALDYGTLAAYRGGYSQGYIAVANSIKLTDRVTIGYTENVTMKELVQILFNALNSKMADTRISTSTSVSISSSDTLYIEEKFNVVKYKGVVTGTSYTRRLEDKEDLSVLVIDDVEYTIGKFAEFDEEALLGQRVYFYLKYNGDMDDTNNAEIIFVNPVDGYNTIVDVYEKDIRLGTTKSRLEYYDENDRERSINISDAIVYYNGKVDNAAEDADFVPVHGSVRAIDNDRDGKYDYVFIKNSVQRLVDVATSEKIQFKYGHGEISIPANNSKILLYRYGAEITPDYLGEWEVLEIMLCKDGESGLIDVSKKIVDGMVTSVKADKYTVGGVSYDLSEEYKSAIEAGHFQALKPTKNNSCSFILDSRGEVAAMVSTLSSITEYGYLVQIATEGGLNKTNMVKMYCQYGIMNIFDVAPNVKVNGKRLSEGEDIEPYFYNASNVFEPQLVRFTRTNGVVTAMDRAIDTTGGALRTPGNPIPDQFSMDYYDTTSWSYHNESYLIEDYYIMLNSSVPVFWIPYNISKESLYHYYDSRDTVGGLLKTTDIYIYDSAILEDYVGIRTPGAIVLRTQLDEDEITYDNPYTLESINTYQTYYVVDTVEETGTNSEGLPIYSVTMAGNVVINFEDTVYNIDTSNLYGQGGYTLGNLEKGDLVQVGYGNDSSKANRFVCLATAKGNGIINNGYANGEYRWWNNSREVGDVDITGNAGTSDAFMVCQVIYKNHPYYVVKTKNAIGEDVILTLRLSYGEFYMYEMDTEDMWKSSYWDIEAGQRMLIRVTSNGSISYGIMVTE